MRSWSLVKIGTATNQRKLFFNLREAKRRISVLDEGDMRLPFPWRGDLGGGNRPARMAI